MFLALHLLERCRDFFTRWFHRLQSNRLKMHPKRIYNRNLLLATLTHPKNVKCIKNVHKKCRIRQKMGLKKASIKKALVVLLWQTDTGKQKTLYLFWAEVYLPSQTQEIRGNIIKRTQTAIKLFVFSIVRRGLNILKGFIAVPKRKSSPPSLF